jgi:RNA polymerase sigma factor (sigma-70 family)
MATTEGLRAGNKQALEDCYRLTAPLVRDYVRRFVPPAEVDDITQQVFLDLWRSHQRVDPARGLVPLLLTIARNRSIDYLRKRRHVVVDVAQLRGLMGEDGDRLIEGLAWAAEVRRALQALPDAQRQAIELAYFGQHTQREIAIRLGVPLGTVKARMWRGMRQLATTVVASVSEEGGPK